MSQCSITLYAYPILAIYMPIQERKKTLKQQSNSQINGISVRNEGYYPQPARGIEILYIGRTDWEWSVEDARSRNDYK